MKKSKYLILLCMSALVLGGCTLTNGDSSSSSSASSSESSSTKEEGASIYALIGDFKDASWVDSPSEGSSYYLDNSVTNYWERTVVTSSQDGSRDNARLAVVNYGTYDIVAGYSSLTSNSSGAFEDSGTNYIGLYWDSTYKVEIDFTNNSKSITITLVSGGPSEGGESGSSSESSQTESSNDDDKPKETGYYSLVGDFEDSSWEGFPQEGSKYRLEYTVGEDSTKYWTREVTIAAAPTTDDDWLEYGAWAAGFRIADVYWDAVSEENIWTTIAGYDALSTSSTGVENYTDSDNNIKLYYWGATYTLTIDLRDSANPSILVTYVSGGTHYEAGSTGDESGSSKEEYDSYYSLVGDFIDSSWDGWPSEDSEYYLGYNSSDNSTKYWEREVTIADEPTDNEWWDNPNTWNASFYVASVTWNGKEGEESEDNWTLIAGYNHLDSSSTGVLGSTDDGGIEVSWNATYKLVIDLRGDTPSILVTLVEDGGDSGYTGDDDEPGSGVSYDSNYVLTGDFVDSSWNGWPEQDSIYYLGYNSNDKDSMYWERTVTIAAEPTDNEWWDPDTNTWNASFYVASVTWNGIEGEGSEDNWTLIAGYNHLASGSTGVLGSSSDGGIEVSWNKTYDLVIDLRGSTPSILVTLVDDSSSGNTGDSGSSGGNTGSEYEAPTDVTYDTYYVLYGAFNGASWNASPTKQTNTGFALGFDSRYPESRYWTRTVTLTSTDGFRIIDYGSYSSLVAGYSNFEIDSASSGLESWSDNDNNFKFSSTGTYDLTIDMRTGNYTILVQPHSSSSTFLESDGNYTENPSAFLDNYSSLNVGEDYIMGADISSIAEVEAAGGKFYDYEGKEVDCIKYLADQGINYARLRLWVDPTDSNGNSYQGGGNDITTDIAIAKRCVEAGMKICLDLHYSDFWTHRGQQFAPKSWTSYSGETLYSTASSWTTNVLGQLKTEGIEVSMVQVGNETNNNAICGTSGTEFFKQCCNAVRSYSNTNHSDDPIKIVIHYALDQDINTYKSYYNALINASVDFDVIGLSYYPYYHLSKGSLDSVLSSLTTSYPTKDFAVMEYSTGWTLTYPWDNQGTYGTTANTFGTDQVTAGGYGASVSEQARCIYDINKSVASIGSQGLGTFYWEPAWLARSGTSWASSNAADYYTSNSSSLSGADVTTWSNQALFDYRGYALDSLKIYNIMK